MNVKLVVLLAVIAGLGLVAALLLRGDGDSGVRKLTASDARADSEFGRSVAVSGDTAIVGVPSEDGEAVFANFGAAYIFQRDEGGTGNWGEVKKLTASDAEAFDHFGTSVAISGDAAIVGQWLQDPEGTKTGTAYVFQRDEGGTNNWGEVAKLTASDVEPSVGSRIDLSDSFGWSVAVGSDTAVVGAFSEDAGGIFSAGAAYVFQRDEGGTNNWGQVKKLAASDSQIFDWFGYSVAFSGDTAVIGAIINVNAGVSQRTGAVYVFRRDEGGKDNWGELTKLTASDARANRKFGFSVAVSGETTVVGAEGGDAGGVGFTGAAYILQRDEGGAGEWGEVNKLTASDAAGRDFFGSSVAVSGDSAVVGAYQEDAGGEDAGAAYAFQRDQDGADKWGEVEKLTASDAQAGDIFGESVAVSGDTVLVGASQEDAGGDSAGAAYVFDLEAGSSGTRASVVAGIVAAVAAGALALGGAGWYARRRLR